jgi:hypothetical protein
MATELVLDANGISSLTGWLPIVASVISGSVVALLGAVTGGVIASRTQGRQWLRDKRNLADSWKRTVMAAWRDGCSPAGSAPDGCWNILIGRRVDERGHDISCRFRVGLGL